MSRILRCAALLIVLAMGDGAFFSPLTAKGGGGGTLANFTWLGMLPGGRSSQAYEVSSNGAVLVGYASNASGSYRAFRRTATTGMQDLGDFGYEYAASYGVSGNGSVVVGEAWNARFEQRAFRWTAAAGLQDLGTLGGPYAVAADISANGLVVVGQSYTASSGTHAFRWTAAVGMQDLGTLGGFESGAFGVSGDGSVVVGRATDARGFSGGMQDLGSLGGFGSAAYDVSDNGSVIVGDSLDANGMRRAFRWTAATGMRSLSTSYSIGSGSYLVYANAVSGDGVHVVGYGYNRSANRYEAYCTH